MDFDCREGEVTHWWRGTPWKANFKERVGHCTSSFSGAWVDNLEFLWMKVA